MTHTGKIGRLPQNLRDQIGHRLEDGLTGLEILDWLNPLPEVQQILDDHFDGRPITEQNLSDWRQAGHLDWLRREEARQAIANLAEQADDVHDLVGARHLADDFALVLVAEIHRLSRLLLSDEGDLETRWKRLREINRELAQLRKQDHAAAKLRLEEERRTWEILRERKQMLAYRLLGADALLRQRLKAEMKEVEAALEEQMAVVRRRMAAARRGQSAPVSEPAYEPEPELDSEPEIEPEIEPETEPEETQFTPPPPPAPKMGKNTNPSRRIAVNRGKSCLEEAE